MLFTTVEKNGEKRYALEDQHCYAPEKMPLLSRKHDGENPRTNTATHQKKCPRYPETMMEKTQGPTLLRTRKNSLVIQKTRWRKPNYQHYYAPEKTPSLSRKHDRENPRKNSGEKP